MKITLLAAAAALLAGISAPAFAYGGSTNFESGEYPDLKSAQHIYEPDQPFDASDRSENERYRDEVQEYVHKAKEYVQAADRDIEEIRDKQREAIRKANNVVEDYNTWVRFHR